MKITLCILSQITIISFFLISFQLNAQVKVETKNFAEIFSKNQNKYFKKKIVITGMVYNTKPDLYGEKIITMKCGENSYMNCCLNSESSKAANNITSNDYVEIEGIIKSFKTEDNYNYLFEMKDGVIKTSNKVNRDDEIAIQKTVTSYFSAIDNGDLEAAKYYLAAEKKNSLNKFLKKVIGETDYYRINNIEILKITNEKSTVNIFLYQKRWEKESEESWNIQMQLIKEGEKWKVYSAK